MAVVDIAIEHLRERGPMHYRDLAAQLIATGKVTTKGKTFPQTISAALARRQGNGVTRVAPGVYAADPIPTEEETK